MRKASKKGFTIIELVVVIAVIAILAAVLIPTFASLINKANESVDMQLVKQMNTVLTAEELTDGKPATVVDAQKVLSDNGIMQIKPVDENNVFYWIGTDNRVLLWEKDEDDPATTGKVIYPSESKKKYSDVTTPSADWADLSVEYDQTNYIEIEVTEGQDLSESLLSALQTAESGAVLRLPANQTINMGDSANDIEGCLKANSGLGKSLTINLNGSTLDFTLDTGTNEAGIKVPKNGTLEMVNGSIIMPMDKETKASVVADSGSSLVLRNINITSTGAAVYPFGNASQVVIDGCTVTGGAYAVATNAVGSSNVRISITNSTLQAKNPVLVNTESETTIDSCNLIATGWGLIVRVGHATVSNTTITTTDGDVGAGSAYSCGYRDFSYTQSSRGAPYWGSGPQMPYSVVTVGDYSNGKSYVGDATLVMNNVKLVSANTNDVPDIVLAARPSGKNVTVTYDENCTVGKTIVFGEEYNRDRYYSSSDDSVVLGLNHTFAHNGTVTVNGTELSTPTQTITSPIKTAEFNNRYEIPEEAGQFKAYTYYSINRLQGDVLTAFKKHYTQQGLSLTDAQWETVMFAAGSVPNQIKTIVYDSSAQ